MDGCDRMIGRVDVRVALRGLYVAVRYVRKWSLVGLRIILR